MRLSLINVFSFFCFSFISQADVISVNFDDGSNAISGSLGAVVPVGNWSSVNFGAAGSPTTTSNLTLDDGTASTADLALSNRTAGTAGGYAGGVISGATGDMAQLYDFRSRNGGAVATISQLDVATFATYDVYVYFNRNGTETFDLSLSGATTGNATQTVTTNGSASAFVEANSSNSHTGNYFVFKGVAGSDFTLTVGDDTSATTAEYVYGMQIVSSDHSLPAALPTIESFTVNDYYISPGTSSTFSWETNDAVSISIDQSVGDVTSLSTDGDGNTNATVNTTTTYTLTATNTEGSTTKTLRVGAGPPKPNILFFFVAF